MMKTALNNVLLPTLFKVATAMLFNMVTPDCRLIQAQQCWTIDIRKRDGLATLLLSIFYLRLSTPEANIAQLVR